MIDAAVVSGAWNGVKFAKDALKLALDSKIDTASREKVQAALDRLGTATDALFEIREELFRLQNENQQLRQELDQQNEWRHMAAQYELVATPGTAVVYQFTGTPEHYACPQCFNVKERQILQDQRNIYSGDFSCPKCKASYVIRTPQEPPGLHRLNYNPYR